MTTQQPTKGQGANAWKMGIIINLTRLRDGFFRFICSCGKLKQEYYYEK